MGPDCPKCIRADEMRAFVMQPVAMGLLAWLFLVPSLWGRETGVTQGPSAGPGPEARVLAALDGCEVSLELGKQTADSLHSSRGWFLGGLGSGYLIPVIGTGVVILTALQPVEPPSSIPAGVEEDCYRRGYQSRCHQKDVAYALLGGALGTGVAIAVVLLVY